MKGDFLKNVGIANLLSVAILESCWQRDPALPGDLCSNL